jgi:amidophosphoribosyltransferase
LAGILALYDLSPSPIRVPTYFVKSMRMLQHRGKAYWKLITDSFATDGDGSFPSDDYFNDIFCNLAHSPHLALGYLSKRSPRFSSMKEIAAMIDGFLVDTDKLYLHPLIDHARDRDSLFKICHIFRKLLLERSQPERACEFLDRHLRGNLIMRVNDSVYAYRESTGFKPLVKGRDSKNSLFVVASENSLGAFIPDVLFQDVKPGELVRLSFDAGQDVVCSLPDIRTMLDPFEFIRDSHAAGFINGKSVYEIRKQMGKTQADFLGQEIDVESAFAEPDYPRPMALGFCREYQKHHNDFVISEGIINDRYDDSDHMTDFSEHVSKNKLLVSKKSLKFVLKESVAGRKLATIQGTIQTGGTVKESIYYLRKANAKSITVIVSYVPTIDGRQVGLYTQNRELIAHKYVGMVSSIEALNENLAREISADSVYFNSPHVLSKGIGIPEQNLWFPEWVRFLDYTSK